MPNFFIETFLLQTTTFSVDKIFATSGRRDICGKLWLCLCSIGNLNYQINISKTVGVNDFFHIRFLSKFHIEQVYFYEQKLYDIGVTLILAT